MKQFEPHGPGNMTPVFVTTNIKGKDTVRQIGSDGSHLKMMVKSDDSTVVFDAIGFGLGHEVLALQKSPFDICYTIEENEFRGNVSLQLKIRDIRIKE